MSNLERRQTLLCSLPCLAYRLIVRPRARQKASAFPHKVTSDRTLFSGYLPFMRLYKVRLVSSWSKITPGWCMYSHIYVVVSTLTTPLQRGPSRCVQYTQGTRLISIVQRTVSRTQSPALVSARVIQKAAKCIPQAQQLGRITIKKPPVHHLPAVRYERHIVQNLYDVPTCRFNPVNVCCVIMQAVRVPPANTMSHIEVMHTRQGIYLS